MRQPDTKDITSDGMAPLQCVVIPLKDIEKLEEARCRLHAMLKDTPYGVLILSGYLTSCGN